MVRLEQPYPIEYSARPTPPMQSFSRSLAKGLTACSSQLARGVYADSPAESWSLVGYKFNGPSMRFEGPISFKHSPRNLTYPT